MTFDPLDPRDPDEPTPWALGVIIAAVSAVVATCMLIGLYEVAAQGHVAVGVGAVVIVCGGAAPTAWTWRRRSVLRWFSWGSMVGLAAGLVVVAGLAAAGVP